MSVTYSQVPSRRAWMISFGLATLFLLGAGYLYYRMEAGRISRARHDEIEAIGDLKARQIWQWRKDRINDANRTARDPLVRNVVAAFIRDPSADGAGSDLLKRLQLDLETYKYSEVLILDPQGKVLLRATEQTELPDPVTMQSFREALERKEALLSDLHRHSLTGVVEIDSVAPVLDEAGAPMVVLIKSSDAEAYLYPLVQYWPTPSETAETLLVRREGKEILYLNELRHSSNAALNLRMPMTNLKVPAVQAALGRKGVFEGLDYRGVPVLADLRPIPDSRWLMVSKVDEKEIVADLRRRSELIAVFIVLAIGFGGAMIASTYRRRQVGLYHTLYSSERDKRMALEEFRATLYSIGDAVVTTDQEGRIQRMNPVAEELSGWTEEQARNRPLHEALQIIEETTRAPVENQVEEILREKRTVGLAEHSVLISRDGSERPIHDSFAPVLDDTGAVTGLVMVFRDQTSERAAQAALQKSERLYHSLFDNMLDGYAYHRMIYEGDQPVDYEFLKINAAFSAMTGLKDVEGKTVSAVIPGIRESDPGLIERYGRVARTGEPERFETFVESLHTWFDISVYSPAPNHFVTVFNDITERKLAEESLHTYQVELEAQNAELQIAQANLKASQTRYFELYDLAPVGYLSLNDKGLILEANLTTAIMLRRGKNDLVNRPLSQFIFPPDQDTHFLNFKNLLRSGSSQSYEVRLLKSDGSDIWALVEATAGQDANGGFLCRMAVTDISLRKRAEGSLENSEALYHSLFENMMDAMIYHRVVFEDGQPVDYEIIKANPAFSALSGLGDVVGKRISEILPGVRETDPRLFEILGRVAFSGAPEQFELLLTGVGRWFRYSVYRPAEGYLAVIFHDITEEKQVAEDLARSEERYRIIAENSGDVITVRGLDLKPVFISPSVERLLGFTVAEAMELPIDRVLTPESLIRVGETLKEELGLERDPSADPGRTRTVEVEEYRKDGGTVWVEVTVSFLRDGAGKLKSILSVVRDITDRKKAECAVPGEPGPGSSAKLKLVSS